MRAIAGALLIVAAAICAGAAIIASEIVAHKGGVAVSEHGVKLGWIAAVLFLVGLVVFIFGLATDGKKSDTNNPNQ